MTTFPWNGPIGILLEAEVPPSAQHAFENRYQKATGATITPGNPVEYQSQSNKWGAELRVYFNDPGLAAVLQAMGIHVEWPRQGYRSGEFQFRANNNDLWWNLVENHGFMLGTN